MKKSLILVAILILSAEISFGQFTFGIKAGYTASHLTSDVDVIKTQVQNGFHAGVFARIGKRVYFQPEFYYNLGGSVFKYDSINSWEQRVTVGTLDIPALLGGKIIDSKAFNWRFMVGPVISFVVNSKVKNLSLTGPIQTDDVNKVNWYIQAGTGIDILFLTLDVRYQWGINQMINSVANDFNSTTTPYPVNSKNNMFVISLGWKFM